ncbi:molybdate ABC transporter substrate-binding protein [Agaribacterium sp. ZY112]|uniref:molybdate ABC transporter substrate-binding protein n=1 Tax=Agaribacterium sp. ZY112 TaxID=3233574 RepID=UPI0035246E4F
MNFKAVPSTPILLAVCTGLSLLFLSIFAQADKKINVAVASNFKACFNQLALEYEQQVDGVKLQTSFASSGQLAAMISRGAPYQLFLSADSARVDALIKNKHVRPEDSFVYAQGLLGLWFADKPAPQACSNNKRSNKADKHLLDSKWLSSKQAQVQIKRLSMANPKHAPYGLAAQQALQNLGLWPIWKSKTVYGQNVAQSLQFVLSGSAQAGFIGQAQWFELAAHNKQTGSFCLLPQTSYAAIKQKAALINTNQTEAALDFFKFLQTKSSQRRIKACGYSLP